MDAGSAKLMRIYLSNTDKSGHKPLYEQIVYLAKEYGIAGATVTKGIMGYGSSSKISSSSLWEVTEKLPVIVELIDSSEQIDAFAKGLKAELDTIAKGCLVIVQDVDVAYFKKGKR